MSILTFDGRSLKSASTHIQDFLTGKDVSEDGIENVVGNLTPVRAYKSVAWLFRAVTIRASLVSRMPYALMKGETEVTDDPAYASLMKGMRRRLFLTEGAKCLTGAAYWLLEANAYGRNVTPRWVLPQSMLPRHDARMQALTSFYRFESDPPNIPLDRVVYFWNPNYESEVLPGPGEAQVSLPAASGIWAMDAFVARFFNVGAVKVTVFSVPKEMQEPDKKSFQDFLNRRLSGLRNALRNIVMRGEISPTVIGSDVKDTEAPELVQLKRDDVAVAMGMPPSVLDGTSANFATAQSDAFGFMVNTIIPECEMLFETANEQLFDHFGLQLVAKPEELEIMQSAQLDQVTAVGTAVGQPVLTKNEGRALLGYQPECPTCGALNEDGAAVCAACGEPMTGKKPAAPAEAQGETITCPKCGTANLAGLAHCSKCGEPLGDAEVTTSAGEGEAPAKLLAGLRPVKADAAHPGAMLAFMLDPDEAALLGSVNGYVPDHLTLVFLAQDVGTIGADRLAALETVLKAFAARCAPLDASISGVGRFDAPDPDGESAVYASVDSPALPGFRQELLRLARTVGIEPETTHGFSPHITLGYIDSMLPTPQIALPLIGLRFALLSLVAGGKRTDFALNGTQDFKARAAQILSPDEVMKALSAWRKAAVEAVKGGRPNAGGATFAERVPLALWKEIDAELEKATTAAQVRTVFARHWPRKETSAPGGADLDYDKAGWKVLVEALRDATAALRETSE